MFSECKEAEKFTNRWILQMCDYYPRTHENFCFLILLLLLLSRFVKVPVNKVWEGTSIFINTWKNKNDTGSLGIIMLSKKIWLRRARNHCLGVSSKSQNKHPHHKLQLYSCNLAVGKESSKNCSNLCLCIKDNMPI